MAKTAPRRANAPLSFEAHVRRSVEELQTTLTGRGQTYADFRHNSRVACDILISMGIGLPQTPTATQANAATMIAAKLSRLTFNPDHADSWLDIAGYAILAHAALAAGESE